MEARILCVGDLHIKVGNVRETRLLASNIISIIKKEDPDHVVILGDTLHRFNIIDASPLTEAVKMIGEISDIKPVTLLIGNHDIESPSTFMSQNHPFYALRRWKDVTVVDTRCVVFRVKGMAFAAVPYVPPGRFREALETSDEYDDNVCAIFCHQEFAGSGYSKRGDAWNTPIPAISGHIHSHSRIGDNILYVGTPRQVSFADYLDKLEDGVMDKTVSLITFGKGQWREKRIPTCIPPKIQLEIRSDEVATFVPPKAGSIKIKITGRYDANSSIMSHPNVVAWRKRGIKIQPNDIMPAPIERRLEEKVTFAGLMRELIGDDEIKLSLFESMTQ